MVALNQLITLTRLTAVEAIRQPIFLLVTNACIVLTAVMPMVLLHQFGEEGKLARDSGLAFHFLFGLFYASYAACSSLAREIGSGTASAVLSKPVSRSEFLVSKFLGLALVIVAFSTCACVSTLMSERVAERLAVTSNAAGYVIDWQTGWLLVCAPFAAMGVAGLLNYYGRRPFVSTAFLVLIVLLLFVFGVSGWFDRSGNFSSFDLQVQWRIIPASILVTLALVVLCAIALSLSARLGTVATLLCCFGIFVLGLLSDYWFGGTDGRSAISALLYTLIPNWQHFWRADALAAGGLIPWSYVGRAFVYAGTYSAAVLILGILSFRTVDIR